MSINYKKAGVDTEVGDQFVDWLQGSDQGTRHHKERIVSGIGGFASLFRIGFPEMKSPCLVTSTDGVGTKVKLASHYSRYETVGQDLVAMCVNDLICCGATPLIFLDYYATGKLDLVAAKSFLTGLKSACDEALVSLVGGETAEMPGVYHNNDFDCAGFAIGVVDEPKALGAHLVKNKDVVLGIRSSGFHSNGYSLLRKVFENDMDHWIDELLKPTALYSKLMQTLLKGSKIHAAANITGGGIDNVPRVIPEDKSWYFKSWDLPAPFKEVQKRTGMSNKEMLTSLNCGIGFALILPESEVSKAQKIISECGHQSIVIGEVGPRGEHEIMGVPLK